MAELSPKDIADYIMSQFDGLRPKDKWGETSFFYNPDDSRAHGTYFFTIKQKNGDNDKASNLDREGVYRLNFCIPQDDFLNFFQHIPQRPNKGGVIQGDYDFTALNVVTPHPVYGWMKWVSVLNPHDNTFDKIKPLIKASYDMAVKKFKAK
jgi:hypothetical protein